jgi:hypothetical protein
MSDWARRVRPVPGPRELQELRDAAHDIAEQSGHAPARGRVVFSTVADCALVGTALLGGALAAVHLYKSLFPKPRENRHEAGPDPASADREPPRHRSRHMTDAAAGHEGNGHGR